MISNALGLTLIGLIIGGLVAFVILVEYTVNHYPNTKLGKIYRAIDAFVHRLPGD
jgi:hypothetical protein